MRDPQSKQSRPGPRNYGRVLTIATMVALILLSSSFAAAIEPKKKILILSSEDPYLTSIAQMNEAIRTILKNSIPDGVTFYFEALEDSRIPGEKYEAEFTRLLQQKYEGQQIDLCYAFGAPALKFLLKHRGELISNTPIIFAVQDESRVAGLDLGSNVTGVWGIQELSPTLDIALTLQPETQRVLVISGSAPINKALTAKAQAEFRPYQNRVEITYLTDVTIQDFQKKLSTLAPKTIVFYLNILSDSAGNSYSSPEALALLAPSSSAPIYATAATVLGAGIVGGRLISYEVIGTRAAETGLRILAGTKAGDIPPQTVPSVNMFDWRQLRRWSISEQRLPPGSIIQFRQPSVWELYKWRIVGVISLFILEAVLIVGLLINRARRKEAQGEGERLGELAKAEHRRLEEVVSNVPGMVWEISIDPASGEQKTQFVSRFVEEMLGYSAEDFLGTKGFGLSLVPAEDRERVERETNEIFASGKSGTLQYRWLTNDGRLIWVEAQLAVMRDDHDRPIGLRGVTMEVTARKLGEEALRQSDARNRDILRAIPDVMFLQTAEGMYLDFHTKEPRTLFVAPEQFLGKNMRDVLPAELAEVFFGCFRRALETDETQIVEYSLTLDNEPRWFEARIVHSKDNQMLSLVRDVTDRRLAEEGERRGEERFAKAFKANPQPMSLTTLSEGRYLDVNESFLTMSGYAREEVIGRTSIQLGIWETPEARVDFMRPLRERGAIHNLETKFRTRSGSFRLLLSSAEQFELGGETCVLVASSDITERHRALEELRQSEERFRNMADSAPVLIWIAGPDQLCTYFNHGWLEFTGRTMEQELGNGWADGIYPEDYARCLEIYRSAFDRHEEFEMEYRLRRADGVFRWIYDIGTPRFSSDGGFLGFIGSCIDIADRKEAEEALRDLGGRLINAQEEERSRVARELHDDISQRIAVLSIGLEQVGQQILAGAGDLHSRIQSLSAETQEISTELHRVSYQLHPSKLDHLGLVSAVKSFCGEVGALHGLSIKFRQEGFPAQLSKDITLCLFRIVQEALHNAAKHSGAQAAQVVLEKTDQSVRLTVSDTGCGFDTESSKMTRGLGFVSMRERLRLVGGQLSIRSRPSEGTQIEVTVPLAEPEVRSVRSKTTAA